MSEMCTLRRLAERWEDTAHRAERCNDTDVAEYARARAAEYRDQLSDLENYLEVSA